MDQFQLERWSAGDVIISIVQALRELRADTSKVTRLLAVDWKQNRQKYSLNPCLTRQIVK